jgi:hypothetical protein
MKNKVAVVRVIGFVVCVLMATVASESEKQTGDSLCALSLCSHQKEIGYATDEYNN